MWPPASAGQNSLGFLRGSATPAARKLAELGLRLPKGLKQVLQDLRAAIPIAGQ